MAVGAAWATLGAQPQCMLAAHRTGIVSIPASCLTQGIASACDVCSMLLSGLSCTLRLSPSRAHPAQEGPRQDPPTFYIASCCCACAVLQLSKRKGLTAYFYFPSVDAPHLSSLHATPATSFIKNATKRHQWRNRSRHLLTCAQAAT